MKKQADLEVENFKLKLRLKNCHNKNQAEIKRLHYINHQLFEELKALLSRKYLTEML